MYFSFSDAPSSTTLTTKVPNNLVRGNDRIVLTCVTDANPPASQYWFYHNDVFLRASLTGKYVIQKARHTDGGTYQCVPQNFLGNGTSSSVHITVFGQYQADLLHSQNIYILFDGFRCNTRGYFASCSGQTTSNKQNVCGYYM